jgi:hypothetical protein
VELSAGPTSERRVARGYKGRVAYADDLAIIVAHDSRQTLKTIAQQALDLSDT